jgi:hypothetical protein
MIAARIAICLPVETGVNRWVTRNCLVLAIVGS